MSLNSEIFQRTELLFGKDIMARIAHQRVIIFGIGGVGSWCAESLIRSGILHLTLVDSDRISVTNINRQLHATTKTVGEVKTDVLKKRLLEINPEAQITSIRKIYNVESSGDFDLDAYDYIIDAIDSLGSKIHLIRMATRSHAVLFSSMGASLKLDPTRIRVSEFWKVQGCRLGSKIRKFIRKGDLPAKPFLCIYSEELLENLGAGLSSETAIEPITTIEPSISDTDLDSHDWNTQKAVINGTVAHITAIYGFTLAGLVIQHIYKQS